MSATESPRAYTLDDFDYQLPDGLIAKYPLEARDQSRMMVIDRKRGTFRHHRFYELPEFLDAGDLVVMNNAKVIPARLLGHRDGHTGKVEVFLLHPQNEFKTRWQALMRPAKRLKPGTKVLFDSDALSVTVVDQLESGLGIVDITVKEGLSFDEALTQTGVMPLPPYMARDAESSDTERYQTVFAKVPGAQAAPTAGLHFTQAVLDNLDNKGVHRAEVTLHVSAGTFRPVLAEAIGEHKMDAELYVIPDTTAAMVQKTREAGKKVLAIGTTAIKTLETSASLNNGIVTPESRWSELFITPGFKFQVADALLTNFHLPKSTLMMLVSAFAERDLIMTAYQEAIKEQYRFYSYGDCMLIV